MKKTLAIEELLPKMENSSEDFLAELDAKVKSMMEKSQNMISLGKGRMGNASVCKVCGKEGQIVTIRDHIEANHLEGIELPCNFCEKTFRSSLEKAHVLSYDEKIIFSPGPQRQKDSTFPKVTATF